MDSMPPAVSKALAFDEYERRVMDDVQDRVGRDLGNDPALTILIAHASTIPTLSSEEFAALESVRVASLREHPEIYRYRPFKLDVIARRVREVTPGNGLHDARRQDGTPFLPKGTKVWEIQGLDRGTRNAYEFPLIIYTTFDPMKELGAPDEIKDGWKCYAPGRVFKGAGIFFRTREGKGEGDGKAYDYPVIVAWQLAGTDTSSTWPMIVVGIAIVVAFFLWLGLRLSNRRRGPVHFSVPTPPEEPNPEEAAAIDPELRKAAEEFKQQRPTPRPPVDGDVDPELKKAAEQWAKEHDTDANKHQG